MKQVKRREVLDRRSFVRGALAVGASLAGAAALGGCSEKNGIDSVESGVEWDEETDVVVIGYGGAGAAATLEATSAGLNVIVLEKDIMAGGATNLSGMSAVIGVNSSIQKELGIEGSVDDAVEYYKQVSNGEESIWRAIWEMSGETIDWLIELGVNFPAVEGETPGLVTSGQQEKYKDITPAIPYSHFCSDAFWPHLAEAVDATEADVRLSTPATELVVDSETGGVIGVRAKDGAKETLIKANKGVVISAGGYHRSDKLRKRLVTPNEIIQVGTTYDDGDGMLLGVSVGAGTGYFGFVNYPSYTDPTVSCMMLLDGSTRMEGNPPYILINEDGRRFINERAFYSYIATAIMEQPNGHAWVLSSGPSALDGLSDQRVDEPVEPNNPVVGDSLAEVAEALGVDPAALEATVASWNSACEEGSDPILNRESEFFPLSEGPYYAVELRCACNSTLGGLMINEKCQVLNALTDEPIPHLYAAGSSTMGMGDFYELSGSAVGNAVIGGRIAGRNVSAE